MKVYYIPVLMLVAACNNSANNKPAADTMGKNVVTVNMDTVLKTAPDVVKDSAGLISAGDTVEKARLIIPGKSIGQTSITEKTTEVYKRLGPADFEDAAMGKSMSAWYSKANGTQAAGMYKTMVYATTNMGDENEASRVNQVRITSPYFMTKEKIGVNSTLETITAAYPKVKKQEAFSGQNKNIAVYDDETGGIAFEINSSGRCVGVCVHPAGERAFNTYLSFEE